LAGSLRGVPRWIRLRSMLEDAPRVISHSFNPVGIISIRSAHSAVVGAHGFVNISIVMVKQVAQQQARIGRKNGVTDEIQVQLAGRPQSRGQLAVVSLVVQIEFVGGA
jgi:hypothetical protein